MLNSIRLLPVFRPDCDSQARRNCLRAHFANHDDPQALNIFLACTLPMAQRMAERKAERVFTCPTDWQVEAMYDGAVSNLLGMFEVNRPLQPIVSNAFQRYLIITIVHGAMTPFRFRQEHWNIKVVEDVTKFDRIRGRYRNPAERELITRDLLEQVPSELLCLKIHMRKLHFLMTCLLEHSINTGAWNRAASGFLS
jgi:hypothetical protein